MADNDRKENGVYAWMASVRASMDNDSSRKIFENQVQSHAFIFLDNYLEHILAGPKQGPIIELVKTPGRKRNVPPRTRTAAAAAARVKNTTHFSLDDEGSKKNVAPVNSFHKALLQAKERFAQDAPDHRKSPTEFPSTSSGLAEDDHLSSKSAGLAEISESTQPTSQTGTMALQHYPKDTFSGTHSPASEHGIHLSIIAEGDESPDQSRAVALCLSTTPSAEDEPPHTAPKLLHNQPNTEENPTITPIVHQSQGLSPGAPSLIPLSATTSHHILLDLPREAQLSEVPTESHTEPLPRSAIHSLDGHGRNAFTAPLPVVPVSNLIHDSQSLCVPLNDSSPKTLPHKSSAAGFPMLPAPSPLRKSMRIAQDAPTSVVRSAVALAPLPLGKRTSWLMKAREAKAMEGTSSLPGTSMAATTRASTAVKRKSGEMLGVLPSGSDMDKDRRKLKVAKSTEVFIEPQTFQDTEKIITSLQSQPVALTSIGVAMPVDYSDSHVMDVDDDQLNPTEEGFIDLFKRTVEDLGARTAKGAGKSVGGAVVAALAEARAAAEARVAERNKVDIESSDSEALCDSGFPDKGPIGIRASENQIQISPARQIRETERRLSLSDLVPEFSQHNEDEGSTKSTQILENGARANTSSENASMTPPDSPPSKGNPGFVKPTGPVFNKPPVFMPPASKRPSVASEVRKEFTSNMPSGQSVLLAAVPLGIPARVNVPLDAFPPLVHATSKTSVQSSQSSLLSGPVFGKQDGIPAWVPSTQDTLDTLYSTDSQSCDRGPTSAVITDDDDDDSWPLEEKLAATESGWRPFDFSNVDKEDTWSSLPTESQGPTRNLTTIVQDDAVPPPNDTATETSMKNEKADLELQAEEASDIERSNLDPGKPREFAETGTTNVDPELVTRAIRQTSMTSAASSQSQVGFFSQATRLVHNMLGGGKKTKPELKSLQLAAAAAKKQQQEADKKTQRLKDMEARRQLATAKKAEEERTRLFEEEKRNRDDYEKRKREREENADRRPKPPISAKKADDDTCKKRKVAPESEKKRESKKLPSRDKKDHVPSSKSAVTPAAKATVSKGMKGTTSALVSSAAYNVTQNPPSANSILPEAKPFKVAPSLKGKAKAKPYEDDIGDKLPSTVVQSQMAARVKAQMQTAQVVTPEIPSESIELPEINSEYSDSEDENRVRMFDPPEWAQSPELHQALQMQSTVNPDDIFGEIRPLRMEEMFRTRQSRFRARTSSANWSGADRLTIEEILEYERRMGFQSAS